MSSTALFNPLTIRGVTLQNRVTLSPLCMYTANRGFATPFHFSHLTAVARGRAALVCVEATAVEPRGRITPTCLGIWSDEHAEALRPIVGFIAEQGSVPAIQLAHAGRKASTRPPFVDRPGQPVAVEDAAEFNGEGPWEAIAPSALPQSAAFPAPKAMTQEDLNEVKQAFVDATVRAVRVGFKAVELHMAHGYLLHSFLSPISNEREDAYGGPSLENRMRFPLEVTRAVRGAMPEDAVLLVRVSCIDDSSEETSEWTMGDTVVFAEKLRDLGVDVLDCSSGGIAGAPRFRTCDKGKPTGKRLPGFQVPFAWQVKQEVDGLLVMAVGVITEVTQANEIISSGSADLVALGRELMYNPYWPLHAAMELGVDPQHKLWPQQYGWAITRREHIRQLNA
jgi:2,4-dienoyl-CoA reductase-like NADH-dependent reductase (Old Yellow Enzyme family)